MLPVGLFSCQVGWFFIQCAGFFPIGQVCGFWADFEIFGFLFGDITHHVGGGGHFRIPIPACCVLRSL